MHASASSTTRSYRLILVVLSIALSVAGNAAWAQAVGAAPARAAVSPEPFFKHADYGSLRLSPSGKYVGALVPAKGRLSLAVLDVDGKSLQGVAAVEDRDIVAFEWVNDNRLVFSFADLQAGLGEQRGGGLYAVNRDGSDFRELAPSAKKQQGRGQLIGRFTGLFAVLRDGSDDVLAISNENNARLPDVYRINTLTGRRSLKTFDKPGDVVSWIADRNGEVRAAVTDEQGTRSRVYWRPSADAKWIEIAESGLRGASIIPVAFDGDGSLIVASNRDRDTFALYRYDADKRALGELIAQHPRVDLQGGLVYDWRKKRIVGLAYDAEKPGSAWFDDEWAALQAAVDKALPDHRNVISRGDAPRALIYSFSDTDPGGYFLLDLTARKLEPLVVARKAIKADAMPHRQPVRYAARDGLEIPAYLTLPPGKDPHNLPLVLYVHGGPWVHGSSWAWNPEAAYLASLGYAVLEPEFRGSLGWGRKLYEASFKQWGRTMQDDLNDGVDWLAKQGTIDAKRTCIMGASYGGYAVMMGLARDPDRWRCGVNYVGVTDIEMMFDVTWSDFFDSNFIRYSAKEMVGDPDKDSAELKKNSPLLNAANIKSPVLMAYGGEDYRVPLIHGERMRNALEKQGTPVEWVVYSEEGHGFLRESNRYDFYTRVAKFLDKAIGDKR